MEVEALIAQLASEGVLTAGDALVEVGAPAVGPVLAELCDEGSPVDLWKIQKVLRRLGDHAFEPLVEAIASAPTAQMADRGAAAFVGLEVSNAAAYVPTLRHRHPRVRSCSAEALGAQGGSRYASALVPLLTDPDDGVRESVIRAFARFGFDAVPLLRRARRSPGPARRAALIALAEVGGWDALDETDQALIERLIRVKIADERPQPIQHLCGGWYAVAASDQAAVLDAFDLSDPMRVTMRMGASAWNRDEHMKCARCRRVYVSPVLDGWTLVFGQSSEDAHAVLYSDHSLDWSGYPETALARCTALSRRFGAAHWYGTSCGNSWTAWCIAEAGEVVRFYDVFHPDRQVGGPHPAEEGYLLPHEEFPPDTLDGLDTRNPQAAMARLAELRRSRLIPADADAATVAARASVDPSALGPHVHVEGNGVLARTVCGRRYRTPPGALDI